jgi:cytochrome c oxidase subunit 1
MHVLGLQGMPRRVYTYPAGMGWGAWNLAATAGSYVIAVAVMLFVVVVAKAWLSPPTAGDNPWEAPDLEWATNSPPPPYNFAVVPVVDSDTPLWSTTHDAPALAGLRSDRPELLITSAVEATPQIRWGMPGPSIWPLVTALGLTVLFVWSIFTPWGVVYGAIPFGVAATVWFWPKRSQPGLDSEA